MKLMFEVQAAWPLIPKGEYVPCRCTIRGRIVEKAVLFIRKPDSGLPRCYVEAYIFQNVISGGQPKRFDRVRHGFVFSWNITFSCYRTAESRCDSFLKSCADQGVRKLTLLFPVCPCDPDGKGENAG